MIVDGKSIARSIYSALATQVFEFNIPPKLSVFTCAPDLETRTYLKLKKEKAEMIGIAVEIVECTENETTKSLIQQIEKTAGSTDGIIVQLPFPAHIDIDQVIRAIPTTHDIDGLNPSTDSVLSPVIGACKEILEQYNVPIENQQVVILGNGRLVGRPAAKWFTEMGAQVDVLTKNTENIAHYTKQADIIVCGAGAPGFLIPEMITDGVVILDAGTSEEGGVLRGDADPRCSEKAKLITPVPNGIGPITIAILLRNLVTLAAQRRMS